MTAGECLDFLYGERREFSKPGLSRMEYMLKSVGNPEKSLRFVHIAGTNGKGSCAAMIASTLSSAGLKTGLYISPDVAGRFEGITVDGRAVTEEEMADEVSLLRDSVRELDGKGDSPTAFEIVTAGVFLWFRRNNCDICVVECGMGGLYDATNVIPSPLCCVIMNVGLDHVKFLGSTVPEIAANKAGIIKEGCGVVFYGGNPDAEKVIGKVCRDKKAKLVIPDYDSVRIKAKDIGGTVFDYGKIRDLKLSAIGTAQVKNACCAAEAIRILERSDLKIGRKALRKGLSSVRLPGRFEVFSTEPLIVYDGAHNENSVKELAANIDEYFQGKKITAVFGVMADKARQDILRILKPRIAKLYAVTPDNPRALDREILREEAASIGIDAVSMETGDAILTAIAGADKNDAVLITGSLYLYKDALPFISKAVRKENKMNDKIITVAIDGPSGAGKSTVAKAIAARFGIGYLDTGAMYRTVALFMDRKIPVLAEEVDKGSITEPTAAEIVRLLPECDLEVRYDEANVQHVFIGDEDVSGKIRTPLISMEASKVSAIPEVRVFLVDMQRKIGAKNSIVMDGRDIGTHVLPDATVKIFLTASPEERARRRFKELTEKGSAVTYEEVLQDIKDRDYGDSHRAASPLRQAEDAVLLDTTDLDLEASVAAAIKIVKDAT